MDAYLALTAKEELAFEQELSRFEQSEKAQVMELMTSWERKGEQEGQRKLIKLQLRRRFGGLSSASARQLDGLSSARLTQLAMALLNFQVKSDLDRWLERHA